MLGAGGVSQQEQPVPRWHLETSGHGRWSAIVGIEPLGQQGEARVLESSWTTFPCGTEQTTVWSHWFG